jgi:hypothetical protein
MNIHICTAVNCTNSYKQSQGLARHIRDEKKKESSLAENLRYHSHLVVRRRGRIPRLSQSLVPEEHKVNHILPEPTGTSDSLSLPANIDIPSQVQASFFPA